MPKRTQEAALRKQSITHELPTRQWSFKSFEKDCGRQTGWRAATMKFQPDVNNHMMQSITESLIAK
ncbi:hypothetical protein SLS58_004342 [Diplodia intermedia]|uniref:Uncharacterized protein n=1 Tax=Diplodia intermedia TaxID=856260 RepID=A0ABR3TTS6_9PEZI